eukprot:9359027-Pyramimonas_sp.AAC.1
MTGLHLVRRPNTAKESARMPRVVRQGEDCTGPRGEGDELAKTGTELAETGLAGSAFRTQAGGSPRQSSRRSIPGD